MADPVTPLDADKQFESVVRQAVAKAQTEATGELFDRWQQKDSQIETQLKALNTKRERNGEKELTKDEENSERKKRQALAENEIVAEMKNAKTAAISNQNRIDPVGMFKTLINGDIFGAIMSLPLVGRYIGAAVNYFFSNPKTADHPNGKTFSEIQADVDRQLVAQGMSQALDKAPVSQQQLLSLLNEAEKPPPATSPTSPAPATADVPPLLGGVAGGTPTTGPDGRKPPVTPASPPSAAMSAPVERPSVGR